jgi:hypothetical protein
MLTKYIIETKIFLVPSMIESNCNAITFINTGTNVCRVNGIFLQPSQSIQFNGNTCEIDVTQYYCNFVAGTGYNELTVVRKLNQ